MSGNKDLMGLIFWMDNFKKVCLEVYFEGKQEFFKEKCYIMVVIFKERIEKLNGKYFIFFILKL